MMTFVKLATNHNHKNYIVPLFTSLIQALHAYVVSKWEGKQIQDGGTFFPKIC